MPIHPWMFGPTTGRIPFSQTISERMQAFMDQSQTWDGTWSSAQNLVGTTLPPKLMIEVTHLPLPITLGLWLETTPRNLGDPLPGNHPLWTVQWGSGKAMVQKAVFNGIYTVGASDLRVHTRELTNVIGWTIEFTAFAFWATAPISLLPGGEI